MLTLHDIRLYDDPVLRRPAAPVVDFDRSLRTLIKDLHASMDRVGGAGLAAPQIGVGLRVFVWNIDGTAGHLVNPKLQTLSEEQLEGPEGCLSFPGVWADLARSAHAVAVGFNAHGDPIAVEGSSTLARCLQHEVDHLDGVLFTDRLEPMRRQQLAEELRQRFGHPLTVKTSPHAPVFDPGLFRR